MIDVYTEWKEGGYVKKDKCGYGEGEISATVLE